MTTQYERDRNRHHRESRRLYALVSAATDAIRFIDAREPEHDALVSALAEYDLRSLKMAVEYADREDAVERAEADKKAAALRLFEELPDAPPRTQCHAEVAIDQGRWTDFHRCEHAATRIVLDRANRRERVVCTIHAKEWAQKQDEKHGLHPGAPGAGWYDDPTWMKSSVGRGGNTIETHASWYRMKGWCMTMVGDHYCKVKVDKGSGKHDGPHR